MPPLTETIAAAAGSTMPDLSALLGKDEQEIARVMQICNACRYCEGFCAVFPAMTRRLEFTGADTHYLANLCHNCGACLYACQYAPPHEFVVNVPKAMAKVRGRTYRHYAWPSSFGQLYQRQGLTLALALAGGLALFLVLATAIAGGLTDKPLGGNFYAIFPHNLLASLFGAVFVFAMVAFAVGVVRFWRDISPAREAIPPGAAELAKARGPAAVEAASDVARLRYLVGGHGEGCNEDDDRFTLSRRWFHQLTMYGFLLCFAATSVATLDHYVLAYEAPYPWLSLPVMLGTVGGIGLLVGPAGLLWLNLHRSPERGDAAQRPMDRGFIALLFIVSLTGLALLVLRDTRFMALWLAIHLGTVMALFLTLPYGKFAHAVFRTVALFKYALEKRLPNRIGVGGE
ncbi:MULTISPECIES: tricarballylate utilization 4Fe-4S protein TcuB [unclassified Bradyrhizobium]|uniref:tricarballylate utilization 4Fe-4S protein TcuB n=1 Tax=unclassified Bradyrhizobium TaxID=2631580 RepID=UPI00291642B1|nr:MULTISPECIES: tricarballylate utilization 4Fe-4S protein TcuB [unclassified Bradyrhizobium]